MDGVAQNRKLTSTKVNSLQVVLFSSHKGNGIYGTKKVIKHIK